MDREILLNGKVYDIYDLLLSLAREVVRLNEHVEQIEKTLNIKNVDERKDESDHE